MDKERFEESMKYYRKCRQEAERLGLEIEISDFRVEDLLHYVNEEKPPLLLALFSPGILHYYTMIGYSVDIIEVIDPLIGYKQINKIDYRNIL